MKPEKDEVLADTVPAEGPLLAGRVYQRKELNARFGGSRFSGIVPSSKEPVVLLFHTQEKAHQYYQDGFDPRDGIYRYSGEGSLGNMKWNSSNRAVRDHEQDSRDLYLFERAQRKDGLWRLFGTVKCVGHNIEERPDQNKVARQAIVFSLLPVSEAGAIPTAFEPKEPSSPSALDGLRKEAMAKHNSPLPKRKSSREVYERSEDVKKYVLCRAKGHCEACGAAAPFITLAKKPFLEVHHINRLAEEGLERIDRVAAICPNCHRRCHYGEDASAYNNKILEYVNRLETPSPPHLDAVRPK